jgi:hypothetical protein
MTEYHIITTNKHDKHYDVTFFDKDVWNRHYEYLEVYAKENDWKDIYRYTKTLLNPNDRKK